MNTLLLITVAFEFIVICFAARKIDKIRESHDRTVDFLLTKLIEREGGLSVPPEMLDADQPERTRTR